MLHLPKSRKRTLQYVSLCIVFIRRTHNTKLARKYHPDTNPDKNARDKFVEIQDAYDVRSILLVDVLMVIGIFRS